MISTVISANSNKSVFGQRTNGPLSERIHLTKQTICREFKNYYINSLLQNTKNISNIMYSFLVTNFVVLNNPQITKARSENFKSEIINFFGLCMLVGISEAIRLLSTYLLLTIRSHVLYLWFLFIKIRVNMLTNINSVTSSPIESKGGQGLDTTNTSTSNSNNAIDGDYANKKFNEWLAGLIDGDGCFQLSKKGYASLEIVMELRDKHCLYQVKDKFGGSVKLRAGDNHLRYRLHHKAGILKLINAVNGLIRNPVRILQLGKICDKYGIDLLESQPLTYNSGWFAGFFDSDGSIYMNDLSGQLFITVSQRNKFLLDVLVELYGGKIYPMVKQGAFKWTCYRKNDILSLVDNYFKVNSSRSEKRVRLNMVHKFYELRGLDAHSATPTSVLGKAWKNFNIKWNQVVIK